MDQLTEIFGQLGERFRELPQGQKVAALVLAAVTIGSLIAMSFWMKTPDFQLLYANLSEQDAAAIVDNLKTQKIPYELSNQGRTIRVPANQVHELRLQMASEGLPEGSDVGLEIFEKTSLGMTDFIQKLNYQRALQGELARTIKTLDVVDQARVHLVIPKETLFVREKPKGKASVTIKVKAGKSLNEQQVQGIVHLVASSVEGIMADNVVVVDLKGNLLSGPQQAGVDAAISSSNYQHQRKVEKELEKNILLMLEDALGQGKVIARVSADLDFEKIDRTEEIYDPDSQVIRSQQSATEAVVGAVPPGGVAGVQAQLPAGQAQGGTAGQPANRNKTNEVTNFEINKVIRHVSKAMGVINRLSVAVLIDGTFTGDPPEYQARSQEDMTKYLEIVQSAVGFDPDRGDQIKVENIQFDRSEMLERQKELEKTKQIDLGFQVAKYLLGAIFIVLFFTRVIRPLINLMTTSVEVLPDAQAALTAAEMEAIEDEKKRLGDMGAEAAEVRKSVAEFVDKDPKYTAGIVRKWMREKTPGGV
ncbi:flagellar M-ring protein FliF [Candidatus Nitromaritima sp. SCGC AAA799-A02]|nr:flagellar M-ring protein FliF [Candidatus Nitromaritima sp. SCGC AAA799-A02]